MTYSEIDSILIPWLRKKGYQLQTQDREQEVRLFQIWNADHKRTAQVGFAVVDENRIELCVFDGERRRRQLVCTPTELPQCLDTAEELAKQWIGS